MVGTGFEATTMMLAGAAVPPPGVPFTTVSESVAPVATSAAANVALTWVVLMKDVGRALPFTWIIVVGTNPEPVTVTVSEVLPISSVDGDTDATVGAGLSISRVMGVPLPLLLTEPFDTVTASSAPLANWLAGAPAVSFVLST